MIGLPYVLRILVSDGDPDVVRLIDKSNWTVGPDNQHFVMEIHDLLAEVTE